MKYYIQVGKEENFMKLIDSISYGKEYLYENFHTNSAKLRMYFQKTYCKANHTNQYFLKLYLLAETKQICQGYIYFYLNDNLKTSDFIGIYIKPEYRNLGLSSLLISSWIQFCLNNEYNFLGTNTKQRKPFLVYLLKTYGFEIINNVSYKNYKNIIDICKKDNDNRKYLLFRNPKQKESFIRGKIYSEDNYSVIDSIEENTHYLDSVILSERYQLY